MRSTIVGLVGFCLGLMSAMVVAKLAEPGRMTDLEEQAIAAEKRAAAMEKRFTAAKIETPVSPAMPDGFQRDVEFAFAFYPDVTIDSIRKMLADQSQVKAWRALRIEKESYPSGLVAAIGRSAPNDRCWLAECDGGKLGISVDSFHG
jgi:hypothetical protein